MKPKLSVEITDSKFPLTRSVLRRLFPALVAALVALCPVQSKADTIALSFNSISGDFRANGTYGWAFTLSSPVFLTQIGLWNDPFGLTASHEVDVWTSAGTLVPGAQATILPTSTLNADGFRYVSIAPVLLPAGDYTIAGMYSGEDFVGDFASFTTASGVTYDGGKSLFGFGFPSGDDGGRPAAYFGPNFQFTSASVPDAGSTWLLLLLGVTTTLGLKRVLRRLVSGFAPAWVKQTGRLLTPKAFASTAFEICARATPSQFSVIR